MSGDPGAETDAVDEPDPPRMSDRVSMRLYAVSAVLFALVGVVFDQAWLYGLAAFNAVTGLWHFLRLRHRG